MKEFVETVFNNFDLDWKKHVKINDKFIRPNELKISSANPTKAKNQLSWKAQTKFHGVINNLVSSINNDI